MSSRMALFGLGFFFGGAGTLSAIEMFGGKLGTPLGKHTPAQSTGTSLTPAMQRSPTPTVNPPKATVQSEMMKYGLPSYDNVRVFTEFVSSINYERRIPNWVLEYFPPFAQQQAAGKSEVNRSKSHFYSDAVVPEVFRAQTSDYHVEHLSRGHLAAAQNHKTTQATRDETFNLSTNIVPQDMSMNGCDWYRLEDMVKKMRKVHKDAAVWVVSGPAFVPTTFIGPDGKNKSEVRYAVIGQRQVAVPTHMFEKAADGPQPAKRLGAAFLMKNGPIPEERPLTAYQVSLSEVERLTGLQFFPALLHSSGSSTTAGKALTVTTPIIDLCRETNGGCQGSEGSFSQQYRQEAKLRTAMTKEQLAAVWAGCDQKDKSLQKEYMNQLQALSSVQS